MPDRLSRLGKLGKLGGPTVRRSFFDGPPARDEARPAWDSAPCPCQWFGVSGPTGRGAGGCRGDVVPRSPQALVPSSSSTTSLGFKAPPAYRTWCLSPRKTLFLRRQAPRLWRPRRRRRTGRGASLPAKPCSFVVEHHVFGAQGAAGVPDVVPHSPQNLVPSSSSTTSLAPDEPTAGLASKK